MEKLCLKAGWMIDCVDGDVKKNKMLLVEDGKIVKITDVGDFPEGYKGYDFSDKYVMPGLMNAHVHIHSYYPYNDFSNPKVFVFDQAERILHAERSINAFLNAGVTFVRNCGSRESLDLKVKKFMDEGLLPKIGFITSGSYIAMTGGHGYTSAIEADGVDECVKATRQLIKSGAQLIKFMATGGVMTAGEEAGAPQLTYDEMKAIIDEAHKANRKTAAHAQGIKGIEDIVRAGIDSVEHGCFLTDEIIDMMLEKDIFMVPTLCAVYTIMENADSGFIPDFAVKKAAFIRTHHLESFRLAYKRGVKIALGTDAGTSFNPPDITWKELKYMVENGMANMDALLAGTRNCAELFGVSELYGTLEEGKMADIIVLDGNPINNIDTLSDVKKVFKEGKEVK